MSLEHPGRRELTQLVPHHVLGHVQLLKTLTVVDFEVLADELRDDGAIARPGPDRLAVIGALVALHLRQQALIDVGTFLVRTAHDLTLYQSPSSFSGGSENRGSPNRR
jgi:hypothetical protein